MLSDCLKAFKSFFIIKSPKKSKTAFKTALCFRFAQTLLNLASSIRGAVFRLILFVKSKSKSNYEFASLIRLYARFARSRNKFRHENIDFLGFRSFKSGFSEGRWSNIASSLVDTRSIRPCIV